jgi:hypothetical protein
MDLRDGMDGQSLSLVSIFKMNNFHKVNDRVFVLILIKILRERGK